MASCGSISGSGAAAGAATEGAGRLAGVGVADGAASLAGAWSASAVG